MIEWILTVALSAISIGVMSYMIVWGVHNFELTVNTIMVWADQQETFLQKMISCSVCLAVQSTLALTSLHCLVFKLGLWTWICTTLIACLVALVLIKRINPLADSK